MIRKRLTAEKRIVSTLDDAYPLSFTPEQRENYSSTLNIDDLGDLSEVKDKPTVFKVKPLQSKYEYLTFSNVPDAWLIFATHVTGIEYCDEIELTFTNGIIDDTLRDEFTPKIVQEIASMIVTLANSNDSDAFFLQSDVSLRFNQRVILRHAQKKMAQHALMVAARTKPTK